MNLLKKLVFCIFLGICVFMPDVAHAGKNLVDALDLSPFVPLILDALMMVATGTYEFFVGNGDGVIYIFIWLCLGVSMAMAGAKMGRNFRHETGRSVNTDLPAMLYKEHVCNKSTSAKRNKYVNFFENVLTTVLL